MALIQMASVDEAVTALIVSTSTVLLVSTVTILLVSTVNVFFSSFIKNLNVRDKYM